MILHSQSLSKFVLIRGNSWLIYSRHSETPNPPILPKLPGNHGVIAQNKPNSQKTKTNTNSATAKNYEQNSPRPTQKNKPNQTQFNPCPNRHLCLNYTQTVSTPVETRHPTYDIRSTQFPLDVQAAAEDNLNRSPKTTNFNRYWKGNIHV